MPLTTPMKLEELVDETSGKEIVATPVVVDKFAMLREKYAILMNEPDYNVRQELLLDMNDVFTPFDINSFLQTTSEFEGYKGYLYLTGSFITKLVQVSYNAGYNQFVLDVNNLRPIGGIGFKLKGTSDQKVEVTIKGTSGYGASFIENAIFTADEVGDRFGSNSTNSMFTALVAGNECAQEMKNSQFTVGTVGFDFGRLATNSTFIFKEAGKWCGYHSENSVFKTSSPQQIFMFKKYPFKGDISTALLKTKNRIYVTHADGSEEEVLF